MHHKTAKPLKQLKKKLDSKNKKRRINRKPHSNTQQQQPLGIPPTTPSLANSKNPNTLRNLMLARTMLNPFYNPQQYGNINNEKNIRDKNVLFNQEIQNDRLRMNALEKENAELEKEAKKVGGGVEDLEKEKRLKEKELEEAKRVGKKTDELELDLRHINNNIKENEIENRILALKRERERAGEKLDQTRDINRKLKLDVEENKLYHELSNIKRETDRMVAENKGLQDTMAGEEFTKPNEAYKEAHKNHQKALYENDLLNKQLEFKNQNLDMQIKKTAILNQDEISALNKANESAIQDQLAENYKLEQQVYAAESPLREYRAKRELLDNLRNKRNELYMERTEKEAQANQLKASIAYGDNRAKTKTRKEKIQVMEQGLIVEKEVEVPVETLDEQIGKEAHQIGLTRGANQKLQEKIDRRREMLKNRADAVALQAMADTLSGELDEKELNAFKLEGKEEAKAEQAKSLVAAQRKARESAQTAASKKAAYEYMKSPEYQKDDKELALL